MHSAGRALLGLFLALVAGATIAAGVVARLPSSGAFEYYIAMDPPMVWQDNPGAACSIVVAANNAPLAGITASLVFVNETTCAVDRVRGGESLGINYVGITRREAAGLCPSGSTEVASNCVCTDPLIADPTATKCIPVCEEGKVSSSGYYDIGPNAATWPKLAGCVGGCSVAIDGTSPAGSALVGGVKHYFAQGTYNLTGATCTVGTGGGGDPGTPVTAPPEDTCAAGQNKGQLNNKTVCTDPIGGEPSKDTKPGDKTTTEGNTTTKTNPDGSTTKTETSTTTSPGGGTTTTTTETTTNPDGSTTTKTDTVKTPGVDEPKSPDSGEEDPGDDEETPCQKTPTMAGCGGTPGGTTGLYSKGSRTVGEVLSQHKNTLMASPLGSATSGFFTVAAGGACPTWSAAIPYLDKTIEFDQMCTPMASNAFAVLRVCLLILASFMAWRIAVE